MRSLLVCSLATILVLASPATAQGSLSTELAAKEAQLLRLAESSAAFFQSRCSYLSRDTCSVPACGSSFEASKGFDCTSGFGSDCGTNCPGMTRSLSQSAIWIPKETLFSDLDAQAFVASTAGVDPFFSAARTASSGQLKAWQLIGDSTGVTRVYPGAPQGRSASTCTDYDARTRPWYVAASSGPKDIILLLDISGSMTTRVGLSQTTREELLRPAVDSILDTLTQNDYVSIVPFSGSATSLKSKPVRGTAANIASLKSLWAATSFGGGTYFGRGFTKAFEQLNTAGEETSSGCTNIIMFLTDGTPTDDDAYVAAISTGQANLVANSRNKAHVFSVAMGAGADTVRPKLIACANEGVFESIVDGVDPLIALRGYYQFLAAGLTDSQIRWSNPYTDAFGLGQMVTAGIPIYDRSQSLPLLVGVAAADVTLTELEAFGSTANAVVSELLTRSQQCPVGNFTQCNLQQLRENSNSGYVCPAPQPTAALCRTNSDAVTRSQCSQQGTNTLNSYLCSTLNTETLLAATGTQLTTTSADCCTQIEGATTDVSACVAGSPGSSSGASAPLLGLASMVAIVAIVCLML